MSSPSRVSVIIIFLNAETFLQEAIESVLAQTYQHWELLLVDDGSSDASSALASRYVSIDPLRIHYLEHQGHQNRGMSESRNLGIQHACGDYIAFLDADDYWLPEKLEIHVSLLDSHPNVGMLYGTAKYWFSWADDLEADEQDFLPELRIRNKGLFKPPQLLPLMLEGKAEVPCTCSVLVRREAVQNVGGFEESFRGMYEDQAFYAKICLSVPVLATGDCLAWYRQHPKSHSAEVVKSGELISTQYAFLEWLDRYCAGIHVNDKALLQTIRRKLWLNRRVTSRFLTVLTPRTIYWLKKWVLRLEEHVLPLRVRDWLWIHN